MRSLNKSEFLEMIESMKIHKKDYDTLVLLMNNLPSNLFVKILEEIFNGNLFFQDFEPFLTKYGTYADDLRKSIEMQNELLAELDALISYRNTENPSLDIRKKMIFKNSDEKYDEFYNEVSRNYADGFIFSIMKGHADETLLEKEFRLKLLRAVENYDIFMEKKKDANFTYTIENNKLKVGNKEYDILNINNILFSRNNLVFSMDKEKIILSEMDRMYMGQNGITEDRMKEIKALYLFFQNNVVLYLKTTTTGGTNDNNQQS